MSGQKTLTMDVQPLKTNTSKVSKTKKIHSKAFKLTAAILLGISIAVFLFTGLVFGYEKIYAGKIYPGVKVAGINLEGKTPIEAKEILDNKVISIQDKQIKLNNNDEVKSIKLVDINAVIDNNQTVELAYNYGRTSNKLTDIAKQFNLIYKNVNLDFVTNFDADKTESKLKELYPESFVEPKDATIVVKDTTAQIVEETAGEKIDTIDFQNNLSQLINSKSNYTVFLKSVLITPTTTVEQINSELPLIQKIVSENITFTDVDKDKIYKATGEQIAGMIVIKTDKNQNASVEINEDGIKAYMADNLVKNINKKTIDKKINAATKAVISEGQDGRVLNEIKTFESIKNILNDRINDEKNISNNINLIIDVKERETKEIQPQDVSANGGTAGLYDGKYIEVNLSQQIMYLFNGNSAEGSFRVSTGKWSMPTPVGTRYIQDKDIKAWSAKYGLYMPFWNGIGGGYGIHELPEWPGGAKEGESHLGTPVSHGCIRLGVGSAETVYNWAPIGTPVVIHK